MKNRTTYISSSVAIKGFNESTLAKSESKDCVVRAFASAFELDYETAHNKVSKIFGRQNRKGTEGFRLKMDSLSENSISINEKSITPVNCDVNLMYWVKVKGVNTLRNMTTAHFLKTFSKGTYIIQVKAHAFTIKDGVVIGNTNDATSRKKVILNAWKIA